MLHFFHLVFFFMLHFFLVTLFFVALWSSCVISMLHFFQCCNFPCCILYILHSFHVVPFSCCTLLGLQFFRVALFSSYTPFMFHLSACCAIFILCFFMLHLVSLWFILHSLQGALFCLATISCSNFFMLHSFILNSFQVAFFSCCTVFLPHFFYIFPCFCLMSRSFPVAFFPCLLFLLIVLFSCCAIFRDALLLSWNFRVGFFSYCSFFVFYSFDIEPFSWCTVALFCVLLCPCFSCFLKAQ